MVTPEITIITTIKNGVFFFETTFESVLEQTFNNWEYIIVDDDSNVNTKKYLNSIKSIDSRVHIYFTEGLGRGGSLNFGLRKANAPYICIIDADDPWHPKKLEKQIHTIKNNQNIEVLCTKSIKIMDNEFPDWGKNINTGKISDITSLLLHRNPINHSSIFIKKKTIDFLNGYDEKRTSQFDYDLWVRMLCNEIKIWEMDDKLSSKRIHNAQSFEQGGKRHRYIINSAKVQLRGIRCANNISFSAYISLISRILWSLLPVICRNVIKKYIMR